jgi:sugar O-acyltransferase (sialic acid O-acetyltransferase NeuD family)
MAKTEILVPLLNANEPEARLVGVHVQDRQRVLAGTLLFTIETTKAATDLEAPQDGFIRLLASEGDTLTVGARLAVLTDTADEALEEAPVPAAPARSGKEVRLTKPARRLAEQLGLDITTLPADQLVTEQVVRQLAGREVRPEIKLPKGGKPLLLVFGGGGHAKAIVDMLKLIDLFTIAGILDDKLPPGTVVLGIRVLGTRLLLPDLVGKGVKLAANGVGGILDITVRVAVFDLLAQAGLEFPALVHPRATVEPSARIGDGVQVFANAYVGSEAVLGARCMVNTNAVVSHDCEIGAYTHIAPGALLAGHVHVGERTLLGMGVTTAIGVRIGSGVRIGNGAILLADVPDRTIIQAGRFWTGKAETP